MAEIESVVCVKNEVFVYRIPARTSNRGYRAAEWKLDQPDWTGRLRVCALGKDVTIKLDDKNTGELFAQCPVESYPSVAVEQVLDSSRYFVLRIQDAGRSAFIGIGFADRGDSFDLLVALQDHFKWVKREDTQEKEATGEVEPGPKLDLGFKDGQTIKINLNTRKQEDGACPKPARSKAGSGGMGLLPPPPGGGGVRLGAAPPSQASPQHQTTASTVAGSGVSSQPSSNVDLLLDLGMPAVASPVGPTGGPPGPHHTQSGSQPPPPATGGADPWGDFASATAATTTTGKMANQQSSASSSNSWVSFE